VLHPERMPFAACSWKDYAADRPNAVARTGSPMGDAVENTRRARGAAMIQRRNLASGSVYYARFTDTDGKRKHVRAGATIEEARRNFRAIQVRMDAGRVGVERPTAEQKALRTITVGKLCPRVSSAM
jgi:hypothetical protein